MSHRSVSSLEHCFCREELLPPWLSPTLLQGGHISPTRSSESRIPLQFLATSTAANTYLWLQANKKRSLKSYIVPVLKLMSPLPILPWLTER